MSNLSGAKRTAGTAFASPSKLETAATSKRARTYYDYYDEEDVESSPEEQWSDDDLDSDSRMSLDDDEWLALQKPVSLKYREDAPITEVDVSPPPASTTQCRCSATSLARTARACADCDCSRWGYGCQAARCGCQGGPPCDNPFNKLDVQAVFGAAPARLHPCFVSWMRKQEMVRPELVTTRYLFDMVAEDAARVEARYGRWKGQPYRDWRARWDQLPAAEQEQRGTGGGGGGGGSGLALQQELVRMAFTTTGSDRGTFFSFCCPGDNWQDSDDTWHCAICGVCMDWRAWHCGKCNECWYRMELPCKGCGGVTHSYYGNAESM